MNSTNLPFVVVNGRQVARCYDGNLTAVGRQTFDKKQCIASSDGVVLKSTEYDESIFQASVHA